MRLKNTCILLLLSIALFGLTPDEGDKLFHIPARTIESSKLIGDNEFYWVEKEMSGFEISSFVTYAQYKIYLREIKADSSAFFYQTQQPDSGMCRKVIYEKYVIGTKYDNYPVLGISWNAAMNYCKWRTLRESKDSLVYMYCLPTCSQWLDAYDYLKNTGGKGDFNKDYSDWLLNSKGDSSGLDNVLKFQNTFNKKDSTFISDYIHLELKKKLVIGDSYLFKQEKLMDYKKYDYYSNHGYRQIGFRFIRHKIKRNTQGNNNIDKQDAEVLKYWGLYKTFK